MSETVWILDCHQCYEFFYDKDDSKIICKKCEEEE
jgi:rRNA maturation endonuclease Nob1